MSIEAITKAFAVTGLSHLEFRILVRLANYADSAGRSAYSHDEIAEECECARESVQRTCVKLAARGLLKTEGRVRDNGSTTSSTIYLFPPPEVENTGANADVSDHSGCDDRSHPAVTSDHSGCDVRSHPGVTSDHTLKRTNKLTNAREAEGSQGEVPADKPEAAAPAAPAVWEGLAADIRTAAGKAFSEKLPYPNALLALLDDPAEGVTVEDILTGVRGARDWHLDRRGEGSMWVWTLAITKTRELAKARITGGAPQYRPAAGYSDGRAHRGVSSGHSSSGKRKKSSAPPPPAPENWPQWQGPPEIRKAVVAAFGEGAALSLIDPARWEEGPQGPMILARTMTARDRLRECRLLEGYQIGYRPQHH